MEQNRFSFTKREHLLGVHCKAKVNTVRKAFFNNEKEIIFIVSNCFQTISLLKNNIPFKSYVVHVNCFSCTFSCTFKINVFDIVHTNYYYYQTHINRRLSIYFRKYHLIAQHAIFFIKKINVQKLNKTKFIKNKFSNFKLIPK